jgi:hypothetical protein
MLQLLFCAHCVVPSQGPQKRNQIGFLLVVMPMAKRES